MKTNIFAVSIWIFLFCSGTVNVSSALENSGPLPPPVQSGCEVNYSPFCMVEENGAANGFSVELLSAALKSMGRAVTYRIGPWSEVKEWLRLGEIQALPLVGRTPERESIFDFTFPYMTLHGAIVVREDSEEIHDLSDLQGKEVAVMKSDNAEEFLRREDRGISIHTTTTFEVALRELSEGRHDAVVMQRLLALRMIKESGLTHLRIVDKPILDFRQDFCFAVREGDRETLALLNEGLALIIADGTYGFLHAKWFAALELPSHHRIVIGGDSHYPPYEYLDEKGHPTGYNVELSRAIAQEIGLDIEIRLGSWDEIRRQLVAGEIDAVQGMFYSSERNLTYDFSSPHTAIRHVAVVRQGTGTPPSNVKELAGKRLMVMQGDIMQDLVLKNGLQEWVTAVPSQEEALRELTKGRFDCALVAHLPAEYWIRKNGWNNLIVGKQSFSADDYCYAVPKDRDALLAQLGEGLRILKETGEYRRIYRKWLGVYNKEPVSLLTALRNSYIVIVPLLLAASIFFVWSWTLRKQVTKRTRELRESEQFLATILESIPLPIFYKNVQGQYIGCNQAFADYHERSKESLLGKTVFDLTSPPLAKPLFDADQSLLKGEKNQIYEGELEIIQRGHRHVIVHKAPFYDFHGNANGIVGTILDITDRKRMEEALRNSECFARATVDALSAHLAILDETGTILAVNRTWREFAQSNTLDSTRLMEGSNYLSVCDTAKGADSTEAAAFAAGIRSVLQGKSDSYTLEYPCHSPTEKRWFVGRVTHFPGEGVTRIVVAHENITERKQAEEALLESRRLLKNILDTIPVRVFWKDRQLRYLGCNQPFVEDAGLPSPEQIIGKDDCEMKWSEQAELYRADDLAVMETGIAKIGYEEPQTTPEGERICLRTSKVPLLDNHGAIVGVLGTYENITQQKRLEEEREKLRTQLIQAQKMESIGRLAGGVAHDFNNMLSIIQGRTEMVLALLRPEDSIVADLLEIQKASERSAKLTRQLLAFARKQTIAPKVLDLNDVIENMLKMLRRLIGENINLDWMPGKDLWPIKMDASQIDQILTNLCINAQDAIAGVGQVGIETRNTVVDGKFVESHAGMVEGEYVLLSVSDNGYGMDEETLARLFEPFFTTKKMGQGTGLGLATVYGIVQQNNGFIYVSSEPGSGTTFKIYLPRQDGHVNKPRQDSPTEIPRSRGEVVLLVEDEPAVMQMCKRALEKLGYLVFAAGNPKAALRMAKEQEGPIHLLITDVIMPEMNGLELAEELKRSSPHIKCLFMSGYTADIIARGGILQDNMCFVQKPFSFQSFSFKVREALDSV